MKEIYVVLGDGGSYIEKAFATREQAENYIKNLSDVKLDDGETWEDYFEYDPCEVEYGIESVEFEEEA